MPHIGSVHVSGAEPTGNLPYVAGGLPTDPHFAFVDSLLKKHTLAYRAPLSCAQLPMLKLCRNGQYIFTGNTSRTIGQPTNSEKPLKYIDVSLPYGYIEYDF